MSRTDDKYLKQLQARYRKASRKERSAILDEFVGSSALSVKSGT
jgi:predicted N-acyltransferase